MPEIKVNTMAIKNLCHQRLDEIYAFRQRIYDKEVSKMINSENSIRRFINCIPFVNYELLTKDNFEIYRNEAHLSFAEEISLTKIETYFKDKEELCLEYINVIDSFISDESLSISYTDLNNLNKSIG